MKHDVAVRAMDDRRWVKTDDDTGIIVGLGQYDTCEVADHERRHPLNKRNWALVSWDSGVRTWAPISELRLV